MLDDKQKILDKNTFLNERKSAKLLTRFEKAKRLYLLLSVFLCLVIIGTVYLLLDVSNIYRIAIDGNVYLSEQDICELSGLSTSNKYIFVNSNSVAERIKTNELIETCTVEKLDNRLIKITVKEKKIIGYDSENNLILVDGSKLPLTKANLYLLQAAPYIQGFDDEQLTLIEKRLKDIDYKSISEISEIHYFPQLKFQDHEIIMRDGNYIFTSVYGLDLLQQYFKASSYIEERYKCYYIEDVSRRIYTSACPWEPTIEEPANDSNTEETVEEDEEE